MVKQHRTPTWVVGKYCNPEKSTPATYIITLKRTLEWKCLGYLMNLKKIYMDIWPVKHKII